MNQAIRKIPNAVPEDTTFFMVRDLNAINGTRIHELVHKDNSLVHKEVRFTDSFTPTKVGLSYAMCLIGNDGFEVSDKDGNIIKPRHNSTDSSGKDINLAADEVIANLEELTAKALQQRVIDLGGDGNLKKDGLIAFLIAHEGGQSASEMPEDAIDPDAIDGEDDLLDDDLEFTE